MSRFPEERRASALELRDVELSAGGKMLSAIAVPYNERADIGFFTEDFLPGSLAKSIKEAARSLPLHVFHDDMPGQGEPSSWPIGVATEWDDDASRLRGVWKLDDSEKAQRAAKLATPDDEGRSMLGYMSIRFSPIRSNWTYVEDWNPDLGPDHKDHVSRVEARLVSVGLVTAPAYANAAVEWVRSSEARRSEEAGRRQIDEWSRYLEQIKAGPLA
jgi:HK97 family phage prohead protease